MSYDAPSKIQDFLVFGEFGDVNPSICDSSTYTFFNPETMEDMFHHEHEGCFLYSRHFNPTNKYLCRALAAMEGTEAAQATASGMGAITSAILQLCSAGDEIVSGWTIYGGTYAFLRNFAPRFGVKVRFTNITDLNMVEAQFTEKTKVLYCESISNPLLEVADIPALAALCKRRGVTLIVDNTFSPMIISPALLGADIVAHSLTKFVNGTSDCVAGCICGKKDFVDSVVDPNTGSCMLLGPVLDSIRAAGVLKNLHSLHIRMKQHSANAQFLAEGLSGLGVRVHYPGLRQHPQHELMTRLMNPGFGYGGMITIDVGDYERAARLMTAMQENLVGYLAVSLGYFKTLFSAPAHSTSSEIPEEDRAKMGLSTGMIRFSVGLDNDVERSFDRIKMSLTSTGII
jgi:methionine-gamma-lyase